MTLIVGDMHFGRDGAAEERQKERALIDCLRAHEPDRLFLLGDVFDAYIEYRTLVPKGFARLQGMLADFTDRGVPVTYLAGNHDLWHRDYFERELGVAFAPVRWAGRLGGRLAVLTHGDAYDASTPLQRRLRPWLRAQAVASAYRRSLPAGGALALAQWVNRNFHEEKEGRSDPERVQALRNEARRLLQRTSAEVVVMGHSHYAERCTWPAGTYVNTGAWHRSRRFATVADSGEMQQWRWNGARALSIEPPDARQPA